LGNDVEGLVDDVVDLAADQVVESRPRAAVGDQRGLETELRVEERARHVRDRADAGVAIAELLGVGLEIRQELFQILSRHVLLRYDRLWREVADADLLEARGRIV